MTRPDQSPDPLDGQVCCYAISSANSQLLETYNLVEKGDVLDYIDDELLAMICFEGSVGFQAKLRKLCEEYIDTHTKIHGMPRKRN